jgi:hypothetical protein
MQMRHKLVSLAGAAVALVFFGVLPASAIDAEPGGGIIGRAAVTIGEATTDGNDETVDRCDCDGGPLEAIVVRVSGGGEDTVRIDRIVGQTARTNDGVAIGLVLNVTNKGSAIVITVRADGGVLGTVERIAVRRTGFYLEDGVVVIDTTMSDLRRSVDAIVNAGA